MNLAFCQITFTCVYLLILFVRGKHNCTCYARYNVYVLQFRIQMLNLLANIHKPYVHNFEKITDEVEELVVSSITYAIVAGGREWSFFH